MSNEEEDKKLSDEKYQEKIIDGLVNGIEKYLKSNWWKEFELWVYI